MANSASDSPSVCEGGSFWRRLVDTALSLQFKATGLVVILTLSVAAAVSGYLMQSSEELARSEHDTHAGARLFKTVGPPAARGLT